MCVRVRSHNIFFIKTVSTFNQRCLNPHEEISSLIMIKILG